MSQHITASTHMSQTTELGPFITIGHVRIRKSHIGMYQYKPNEDGSRHFVHIGYVGNSATAVYTEFASEDAAVAEIEKLDWMFKKEYNGWEKE